MDCGLFQDAQYRTVVTTEEVTVYRTFEECKTRGSFVTSSPAKIERED